jgi:hypothetical protein
MPLTVEVTASPGTVTQGGVVTFRTRLSDSEGRLKAGVYLFSWRIEGPSRLSGSNQLGTLTPARGVWEFKEYQRVERDTREVLTDWVTSDEPPGSYVPRVEVEQLNPAANEVENLVASYPGLFPEDFQEQMKGDYQQQGYGAKDEGDPFTVIVKPLSSGDRVSVTMNRAEMKRTDVDVTWAKIRASANALSWDSYERFMDVIVCGDDPHPSDLQPLATPDGRETTRSQVRNSPRSLPYPEIEPYRVLKAATEVFMTVKCGVHADEEIFDRQMFAGMDLEEEGRRLNRTLKAGDLEQDWRDLLEPITGAPPGKEALPYMALIRGKLKDVAIVNDDHDHEALMTCAGILRRKLTQPTMIELIWSYWHEEAMLVQTVNAITWRFQNRRTAKRDPLAALEIDPLRPLNPLIWGFVQDEVFRLTLPRRAYEYDHHYGLSLIGKAVQPAVQGADSRSRFLEAFHHLLNLVATFYKEDDDTTVIADGFPVLNALKEVHLLLTQGAHNQHGELPWVARQEMLMMQWMLARPEMREFLPTRIMVAYPEPWMDRVESMKSLQGWSSTSVLHFRDLGVFGEQILLGIRFTAWTKIFDADTASNWARYWRPEIQGYIHAYRAVTGVDLTSRVEATQPAVHLQRRLTAEMARR